MKAVLLEHTPNPEQLVATAAKLCYSKVGVKDLKKKLNAESTEKFLNRLIELGHESPLEHITFTFGIEGISRSCSHQLVRHRIASHSQQSQRYVNLDKTFEYITPECIKAKDVTREFYEACMNTIHTSYIALTENLKQRFISEGMDEKAAEKKAIENARYILPNACETKLVITMNARSLLNFFKLRCCNRAQDEIRAVADEMLKLCKKTAPLIFKYAGAPCMYGNCTEGKMCCGNPRKGDVIE